MRKSLLILVNVYLQAFICLALNWAMLLFKGVSTFHLTFCCQEHNIVAMSQLQLFSVATLPCIPGIPGGPGWALPGSPLSPFGPLFP